MKRGERQEITVIVERREGNDCLHHVIYFRNQSLERHSDDFTAYEKYCGNLSLSMSIRENSSSIISCSSKFKNEEYFRVIIT